jgi:hypothetical protein
MAGIYSRYLIKPFNPPVLSGGFFVALPFSSPLKNCILLIINLAWFI